MYGTQDFPLFVQLLTPQIDRPGNLEARERVKLHPPADEDETRATRQ